MDLERLCLLVVSSLNFYTKAETKNAQNLPDIIMQSPIRYARIWVKCMMANERNLLHLVHEHNLLNLMHEHYLMHKCTTQL